MNLCLDCKFLERGLALEDHICTRPGGDRLMYARESYSPAATACTQLGRFFQQSYDGGIAHKSWGDE